jgi:hypothetical protein
MAQTQRSDLEIRDQTAADREAAREGHRAQDSRSLAIRAYQCRHERVVPDLQNFGRGCEMDMECLSSNVLTSNSRGAVSYGK